MTKAKIFFGSRPIAPPWDEGSKNLVYGLAQNLEDFNALLLTYKNSSSFPNSNNVTLKPIFPKARLMTVSLRQKAAFFWSLLTTKADIYHFFFSPEIVTAQLLRWIKLIKRGVFVQTIPTPLKSLDSPSRYLFGDVIVVSSHYTKKILIQNGFRSIVQIYPGIDTNKFKPITDNPFKKRLNLDPKKTVVLYPGSYYLGCHKNLIQIVQKFSKTQKDVIFIFACRIHKKSDQKSKEEIKKALEEEISEGNLLMLDSVDNMPQLLDLADIIIFPPAKLILKSEIPIVLLEALALEKPIIITNIPPLNEIMKQDIGEMVPPDDFEALNEALYKLIKNPGSREIKGANGRNMVQKEFNISKTAEDYRALYNKIISRVFA